MRQGSVAGFWELSCQGIDSAAQRHAVDCCPEFQQLMAQAAARFSNLPAPRNSDELHERHQEQIRLMSLIGVLSHANRIAAAHPHVAGQIVELGSAFAERIIERVGQRGDDRDVDDGLPGFLGRIFAVCCGTGQA